MGASFDTHTLANQNTYDHVIDGKSGYNPDAVLEIRFIVLWSGPVEQPPSFLKTDVTCLKGSV